MNNVMYCFEGFPYPSRGGISQVSIREAGFLYKKYGIKSYCLCLRVEPECTDTNTFFGHIIVDYSSDTPKKIAAYIVDNKISFVIFQVIWNFKLFRVIDKACRMCGAKLISTIHGQPVHGIISMDKYIRENEPANLKEWVIKLLRPLYMKYYYLRQRRNNLYIYNHSSRYVSLTPENEMQLVQLYHMLDTSKLCSIANPLSFDDYATEEQILSKEKHVLIVGRFEESTKRISLALKIWSEIEKRGANGWKLIVVGDGEAKDLYHQIAHDLRLQYVSFEGRQHPLTYYQKAAIFMLTSSTEGFSLTLIEAQQNGVVPIAMDTFPALKSIVKSGFNGIVVPDKDIKLYVDNLYQLMCDVELRHQLAGSAVKSSHKFSLDTICTQWYRLFDQIINER